MYLAVKAITPFSVNLIALFQRFINNCFTRYESVNILEIFLSI